MEGDAMHKVLSAVTVGSVGDLGRIAGDLAEHDVDIEAIGGGEATVGGLTIGTINLMLTQDDDADDAAVVDRILSLDLGGGRTPDSVRWYPCLHVELENARGAMAQAAALMGDASPPINIMAALLIDAHADWAVVAFAFEDGTVCDQAQTAFETAGIAVLEEHGGSGRRRHVDNELGGRVLRGDPGRG
jgi:hypothetical protein